MKKCILIVMLASCLIVPFQILAGQADEMYSLSAQLNKLVTAAEGYANFTKPPLTTTDKEFLQSATIHDPELLKPFTTYNLILKRNEEHISILICSKEGKALMQDVGCTNQFDTHFWNKETSTPCDKVSNGFDICIE